MGDVWAAFRAAKQAGADIATLAKLYRAAEAKQQAADPVFAQRGLGVKKNRAGWNAQLTGAWRDAHPPEDDRTTEEREESLRYWRRRQW